MRTHQFVASGDDSKDKTVSNSISRRYPQAPLNILAYPFWPLTGFMHDDPGYALVSLYGFSRLRCHIADTAVGLMDQDTGLRQTEPAFKWHTEL